MAGESFMCDRAEIAMYGRHASNIRRSRSVVREPELLAIAVLVVVERGPRRRH
jgi:hypothetical protein